MMGAMRASAVSVACAAAVACGGEPAPPDDVFFDLAGAVDDAATFWNLPFPSDLRLTDDGRPDLTGYPNPRRTQMLEDLLLLGGERHGFPVLPVVYVRFREAPPARSPDDVVPASRDADVLLVDVDPDSPERGRLVPTVVQALPHDGFAPPHLVAIAPRPGLVLAPATTYALVLRRAFAPAAAPPRDLAVLAAGDTPDGPRGAAAARMYAPLWATLAELGVDADDVLAATVFTTGDEVALLARRSEAVRATHDAVVGPLAVDPVDGAGHDGYCELVGTVTFPVFQVGTPPYPRDGRFALDGDGAPIAQGTATVPLVVTLPAGEMPASGWPLYLFFHGSGGVSSGVVDLGRQPSADAPPTAGEGPAYVVARHGIAAASSALPLNPERLPGASDTEYLNFDNLTAFPYTFQQGVLEQRLLLDALLALRIDPAAVAACPAVRLPDGVAAHRFDPDRLVAGGQSMGGMYTNLIGAVEPRLGALVPTGAGGFWNLMILDTSLIPGARAILAALFQANPAELRFLHPAMSLLAMGWEIAEPMASMARLARRPLPGFPVRHVYEPVGQGDIYFPTIVFDAAALAYGNQQAGEALWPSMQDALAADGLDGVAAYPVSANVGAGAAAHTGVVVQLAGDGIADPHYVFRQLDAVKHQYGCFLRTYLDRGVPTVPAPGPLDAPCD